MRCKACDSVHARPQGHGDWYCTKCTQAIKKTLGKNFGMDDVYRIMIGEDEPLTEEYRAYPNLWRPNG